jgi:CubicO group peptidase (beta-lactamase class C family)
VQYLDAPIVQSIMNILRTSFRLSLLTLMLASAGVARGQLASPEKNAPATAATNDPAPAQHLETLKKSSDTAAAYSEKFAGRAMLVLHEGEVVFERYANDWSADKPHPLASGTKSFTGVLAMLAVQDGLLSLDELAADTITEWKPDPRKSKITVRHLLTLSSGLAAGDRELGGRGGSRVLGEGAAKRAERLGIDENAPRPDNLNLRALELDALDDAGEKFRYGPSHFYVFSEILQRKLTANALPQKSTLAFLRERLLSPIGINVARIGRDRAGNPNLPGGMMLTAREWAKFGLFILNQGSVTQPDGSTKTLLKPELLAQCFEPSAANPSYGLTWWLHTADAVADGPSDEAASDRRARSTERERTQARRQREQTQATLGPDGKPLKVYMAAGLGKQRLYVIPQHNLVVVRFAESTTGGQRFEDREFLSLLLGITAPAAAAPAAPTPSTP